MKLKLFGAIFAAFFFLTITQAQSLTDSTPAVTPTAAPNPLTLIPGAPAFNTNGLSFTNVNYKVALGTELQTAGTFTYAQGDADLWHPGAFDVGLGTEVAFSPTGTGLHSAAGALELIKNFPNWQLTGKLGYGRVIEANTGNYLKLGFDLNYNLAAGTGLSFLGTGSGSFTYVGAGVSWANRDFQFNPEHTDRMFHVYLGWAF